MITSLIPLRIPVTADTYLDAEGKKKCLVTMCVDGKAKEVVVTEGQRVLSVIDGEMVNAKVEFT